ncbi:MAG: carbamoyltransferase, partial [Acidobacteria bacterium]|nr:carbamoyltransferase [Acidobacteriota bacterium]
MKVLGISPLDKDSTVSLMEDGRMLFAAAEERFTRVKLQSGFPWHALESALQATGTTVDEISCVTYPFLPWQEETRLFEKNLSTEREFLEESQNTKTAELLREAATRVPNRTTPIPGLREPNERMEKSFAKTIAYRLLASDSIISRNVAKRGSEEWGRTATAFHKKWHEELESSLQELGLTGKLKRVEHHLSHAANAYYTSGFADALIVTLDGYGSGLAGSVSTGRNGTIERLHGVEFPHSLGTFY